MVLSPIESVRTSWDSTLEAFKTTQEHERKVTSYINRLYELAIEERDYAAQNTLKWFIDEQIEEEENVSEMIYQYEAVEGNRYGLLMMDKELAGRTYSTPSPLAQR